MKSAHSAQPPSTGQRSLAPLHDRVPRGRPTHTAPPPDGGGLVHVRVFVWMIQLGIVNLVELKYGKCGNMIFQERISKPH